VSYRNGLCPWALRIAWAASKRLRWLRRKADRLAVEIPIARDASDNFPSADSRISSKNAATGQKSQFPEAIANFILTCSDESDLFDFLKQSAISSGIVNFPRS
jgi:hypothetical protein